MAGAVDGSGAAASGAMKMQGRDTAGDDVRRFAEIVRARRRELGLSQEAVAAQAFGNPDRKTYVSALENKRRSRITVDTATKLAAALEMPSADLPASLRPPVLPEPAAEAAASRAESIAAAFNAQLRKDLSRTVSGSYRVALGRGLHALGAWTGPAFSGRSLAVCLALSFLYVVATGLVAYGAGGGRVGDAVPFSRPDWAADVPRWTLAALSATALLGSGLWAYRVVRPPDRRRSGLLGRMAGIAGGAAICGAGCALARFFGAEPIAVALTVALFAFGALSAWPARVAAAAGIAGAFIAGVGNGVVDERGLPFGLGWFLLFGGLLGAMSGAGASGVARAVAGRAPAALTGAGVGVGIGALGAGSALALTSPSAAVDAGAEALVVLMWVVLPIANAVSDYVSLGISHTLARRARRLRSGWASIGAIVLVDLAAAVALTAATLLLIGSGLAVAEATYGLDFQGAAFVAAAAADPWGDGLWLTLMVLTTLVWTYAHVALVVGPVVAATLVHRFVEAPLRRRIDLRTDAGRIDTTTGTWLALRHLVFAGLVVLFAGLPIWLVVALLDDVVALAA